MKKHSIIIAIIVGVLAASSLWSWHFLRGVWPTVGPAPSMSPTSSGPLTAPDGWSVSLVTDQIPGARDMVMDSFGNLWVSQTSQGTVSLVYLKDAVHGQAPQVEVVLRGLKNPHGLAFDPSDPYALYIAQETSIIRLHTYSEGGPDTIATLPAGDRHFTRSLLFGADGRLYVSIGSTCDVCREKNTENGSVISMKPDGSDRQMVAHGLRNSVFMALEPDSKQIWATEMGRDWLGDDLPPDEVNAIIADGNYGWPICYGNRIHDTDFDKNQYIRDPCADTVPPVIEIPAHSAPLGLAFLSGGDLLVALHGSWNRSTPIGYKVVRYHWSTSRKWVASDFLTGFLQGATAIGRPVDVLVSPSGTVYVSDDKGGAIWKIAP